MYQSKEDEIVEFIIEKLLDGNVRGYKSKDLVKDCKVIYNNKSCCNLYIFRELAFNHLSGNFHKNRKSVSEDLCWLFRPRLNLLYKLFHKDKLVYIGQTTDITQRVSKHKENKKFDNVSICVIDKTKDLSIIENKLILDLQPVLNKTVNLKLANSFKGDIYDYTFTNYSDLDLEFIPSCNLSSVVGCNKDYLYIANTFIKNTRNITPYWKEK
ncbi:hypothetical protein VP14_034 [Vibrio phage VPMCC14]|nr:hypothetical protein VP14_034 [Vibrio phage VPMCC14]